MDKPNPENRDIWTKIAEAFRDCDRAMSPIEVAKVVFKRQTLAGKLLEMYNGPSQPNEERGESDG